VGVFLACPCSKVRNSPGRSPHWEGFGVCTRAVQVVWIRNHVFDFLAQGTKARFGTRRTTSYHQAWMEGGGGEGEEGLTTPGRGCLMGFGEPLNNPGTPRNPPRSTRTPAPEHPGTARSGANAVRPQANQNGACRSELPIMP
jgi:hypothetical protein